MQSWRAFEQPKEEISPSRIEILVEQTRTGARTSLQSGSLVPSDCHWAVFLDDIVRDVRFYCSNASINMLLWEWKYCWREGERRQPGRATSIKKLSVRDPSKPLVTALSLRPMAFIAALLCLDSNSPKSKVPLHRRSFQNVDVAIFGVVLEYYWAHYGPYPHATPHHFS